MFVATVDAADIDLVNKVAAIVSPGAFDRRQIGGSQAEQRAYAEMQERNRGRAREVALEVLAVTREACAVIADGMADDLAERAAEGPLEPITPEQCIRGYRMIAKLIRAHK